MESMKTTLENYIRAGYPCLVVNTSEEQRALGDIIAAASSDKAKRTRLATWSAVEGVCLYNINAEGSKQTGKESETEDLRAACLNLSARMRTEQNVVIVLRDAQHYFVNGVEPSYGRALRDLITDAPSYGCCVMLLGPDFKVWSSIEKLVTVVDYSLPNDADLTRVVDAISKAAGKKEKANEEILNAISGLSMAEAENALSLAMIETGKFDSSVIYREKVAAVKRSGLLEVVAPDPRGLDAIGGLDVLKNWILTRKAAFGQEAINYGLPAPKGVLLVGVPGSGKSLSAKAFGTALGIPTLKLDIGALFGSLVGESEKRTREALALAEAMSPCVIWCDEVDKGLSGVSGSGSGDSGTSRRVFGTILNWMQEHKKPCFVVMTANDVSALPPEFLRRGRFDELFAIDLPNTVERTEIVSVMIRKVNRKPENFDVKAVAAACVGYTGAEIEAVVNESLFAAFDQKREPKTSDMLAAVSQVIPIAKTMSEKIDAIRKWADGRARMASKPEEKEVAGARKLTT